MKAAFAGVLIGAGLVYTVILAAGPPREAFGQRAAGGVGSESGLIALAASVGDDRQQVTIIDPKSRVVTVYHIEPRSGEIVLKSVRNITWDLQMVEFNSSKPVPQEIRSLLERR